MHTTATDNKTETTKVIFLIEAGNVDIRKHANDEVFAYFPNDEYHTYPSKTRVSYAHIGQHSACSAYYARNCRLASEAEYNELKNELTALGYNLDVQKSKRCLL